LFESDDTQINGTNKFEFASEACDPGTEDEGVIEEMCMVQLRERIRIFSNKFEFALSDVLAVRMEDLGIVDN
jgi:hypothetical protein